jgi:hypothetical protein
MEKALADGAGLRRPEDFTEHADGVNYEMNRNQIIAKTLDDMRAYETDFENSAPGSADRDAEYNRDIFNPEMLKRLPDGDITACEELQLETGCCPTCHGLYPHYEMNVVNLPDGRTGWICCAVKRALFPETAIAYNSPESLELLRMLGGDESRDQGA